MVQSFSPGLDKLGGEKTVPYNLLNQQLISLLARLLDKSLHHLLQIPAGADPYSVARNVYRNIRKHFQGQEWINKDVLSQKWNAITECITPETTYNELLRVNDECSSAGVGHTAEQMATKFAHLLQTHHPTAYIGLFSDLAKAGECATIQGLWHTVQITANALEKNTAKFSTTHSFGLQAHQQGFATQNRPIFRNPAPHAQPPTQRLRVNASPCNWCGGPHPIAECYARDHTNVQRYPSATWPGGVPPSYVLAKFSKNQPRNPQAYSQRKVKWTPQQTPGSPGPSAVHFAQAYPAPMSVASNVSY
jgi:hypothetical protein